ncbi:MAG: 50S ribosomal protein L4 [Deltaproteobacteria bacterium]|nr:MAG: 50S ribosomal protein L4 [Deltaproteobacteria bacterium]
MGIKVDVYNLKKEKVSEIELNEDIFDVPIKKHILHLVVVSQLSAKRAGTASAKTRGEVSCSGRKMWRQKGTGRARVGDAGSPIRVGGGVAFPPKPRDYTKKVNKKVRKAALRMALTDKLKTDGLIVIDDLELPEIKTKHFVEVMKRFDLNNGRKTLLVTSKKHINLEKSSHNVPWVKILRWEGLNVYDLLYYDHLLLEEPAIKNIEEALG